MDILIKNNDIVLDTRGSPVVIEGFFEAVQRAWIAASVKRGSFVYNNNLGNDAHLVDINDEKLAKKIEMLLNEAVINIKGLVIKVENVLLNSQGKKEILIKIEYFDSLFKTKVIL